MLSRQVKATFYFLAGPAMKLNGWLYRRLRAPRSGTVRVHLGPGQRNYLSGWVNVDANAFTGKCDVLANLVYSLPFPDGSVEAIYSHHVIGHLPDLDFHFAEMFRVLKPGGVFRVGGPNADAAVRKYVEGDSAWFSDFPVKRRSLGGRLENFIFVLREHVTMLTPSFLEELATAAGFLDLRVVMSGTVTGHPKMFDAAVLALESESCPESPQTLLMEGRKPGSAGGSREQGAGSAMSRPASSEFQLFASSFSASGRDTRAAMSVFPYSLAPLHAAQDGASAPSLPPSTPVGFALRCPQGSPVIGRDTRAAMSVFPYLPSSF